MSDFSGRPFGFTTKRGINSYNSQVRSGEIDEPARPRPRLEPAIQKLLDAGAWIDHMEQRIENLTIAGDNPLFRLAVFQKRRIYISIFPSGNDVDDPYTDRDKARANIRAAAVEQAAKIARAIEKVNSERGLCYAYLPAWNDEAPTDESVVQALAGGVIATLTSVPPPPVYRPAPRPRPHVAFPPLPTEELDAPDDFDDTSRPNRDPLTGRFVRREEY